MSYVVNEGTRIRYEVEGDGPPLVLHHGITYTLESWYDMGYVAALARTRRLVLLDARGHGASDKPHEPSAYTHVHQASDVLAVMDTLGIARAEYYGYSMGARLGFALATLAPSRFTAMILGAMSPAYGSREGINVWIGKFRQGMDAFLAWWEEDGPLPEKIKARVLANDAEALAALMVQRLDEPGFDDVLPTMALPCLVYAGTRDWFYAGAEAAAARMPNASFVSLSDLTHGGSFFRSDLILPHVTRFLATQPAELVN